MEEKSNYFFLLHQSGLVSIDFSLKDDVLLGERVILILEVLQLLLEGFYFFVVVLGEELQLFIDVGTSDVDFFEFIAVETLVIFVFLELGPEVVVGLLGH